MVLLVAGVTRLDYIITVEAIKHPMVTLRLLWLEQSELRKVTAMTIGCSSVLMQRGCQFRGDQITAGQGTQDPGLIRGSGLNIGFHVSTSRSQVASIFVIKPDNKR
jgi:hypothetical protein